MSIQATNNTQAAATQPPRVQPQQTCWGWITTTISSIFEFIKAFFACLCCCDRTETTNTTPTTTAATTTATTTTATTATTTTATIAAIARSTLRNREAWVSQLNQAFHSLDEQSIRYSTVLENALVHSVPTAILQIHAEHPGDDRDLNAIRRTIIDLGLSLLTVDAVQPIEVQERQSDGTYRRNAYLRIVLDELDQTPQNNTTAPTSQTNATPAPTAPATETRAPATQTVSISPSEQAVLDQISRSTLLQNKNSWVDEFRRLFVGLNTDTARYTSSYHPRYRVVYAPANIHSVRTAIVKIYPEYPQDCNALHSSIGRRSLFRIQQQLRASEEQELQPDGTYRRNAYLEIVLGALGPTTATATAPTAPSSTPAPTPPYGHRFLDLFTDSPEWVRQLTLVFQALNTRFGTSYQIHGDIHFGLYLEPTQQQHFEEFHQLILNNLTPEYRNKVAKWRAVGGLAGNSCTQILFN